MIYLDYQATTPVAPEVVAAMRPWIEEKFANPHSPSTWGREAAAAIEVARDRVLTAVGLDEGRFAFTSGATEALNWAIKGTIERSERRRVVTIATEHAAVLDSVKTRIRPIFMTTLGGLAGLLPLVLAPGAGSELYRGIGAVLLGGLLLSTVITLVFVPALLSFMLDLRAMLFRKTRRVQAPYPVETEEVLIP